MSEQKVHIKRRVKRRKVCSLCVDHITVLDYKDTNSFKRYITERGKIIPRRNSGVCAKHQRVLATAIKRARFMGLVPHTLD